MSSTLDLLASLRACRTIDLAQPYYVGAPHHPSHPAYLYSLNKKHGDYVNPGGASSAADAIALGTHVGTHIDALCHFSCNGQLHGGIEAAGVQSYAGGVERHTIDRVEPLVRRGVLARCREGARRGCSAERLCDSSGAPRELRRQCARGRCRSDPDRLGKYWDDAAKFISEVHSPGPGLESAKWLSARRVFAAGSDTAPFEFAPSPEMSVHVHLLVESGIHIIECLNLEELSASGVTEFIFIALPLKIRGGTGSPIRPIALISVP